MRSLLRRVQLPLQGVRFDRCFSCGPHVYVRKHGAVLVFDSVGRFRSESQTDCSAIVQRDESLDELRRRSKNL